MAEMNQAANMVGVGQLASTVEVAQVSMVEGRRTVNNAGMADAVEDTQAFEGRDLGAKEAKRELEALVDMVCGVLGTLSVRDVEVVIREMVAAISLPACLEGGDPFVEET